MAAGNSAAGVLTQLSEASNSSSSEQDDEAFINTSKFYTCTVTLIFISITLSIIGNNYEH